jgi:hypothetical protein
MSNGWVHPDNVPEGENLKKFGNDLTELAKRDKLDPVIGRDAGVCGEGGAEEKRRRRRRYIRIYS